MRKLPPYEGSIEDGRVKLPPDAGIPDRIRMRVVVRNHEAISVASIVNPHLANREKAKDFEKSIIQVA